MLLSARLLHHFCLQIEVFLFFRILNLQLLLLVIKANAKMDLNLSHPLSVYMLPLRRDIAWSMSASTLPSALNIPAVGTWSIKPMLLFNSSVTLLQVHYTERTDQFSAVPVFLSVQLSLRVKVLKKFKVVGCLCIDSINDHKYIVTFVVNRLSVYQKRFSVQDLMLKGFFVMFSFDIPSCLKPAVSEYSQPPHHNTYDTARIWNITSDHYCTISD